MQSSERGVHELEYIGSNLGPSLLESLKEIIIFTTPRIQWVRSCQKVTRII